MFIPDPWGNAPIWLAHIFQPPTSNPSHTPPLRFQRGNRVQQEGRAEAVHIAASRGIFGAKRGVCWFFRCQVFYRNDLEKGETCKRYQTINGEKFRFVIVWVLAVCRFFLDSAGTLIYFATLRCKQIYFSCFSPEVGKGQFSFHGPPLGPFRSTMVLILRG